VTDLGSVASVFPLRDGRWCNCGVRQSASDWTPSKFRCVRKRSNRQGIVYRRPGLAPRRVPVPLIADRQPFATSIDCPHVPIAKATPAPYSAQRSARHLEGG
jgi:hypothetical protein